ncbi:MAG TPA: serine/threonine-protein kinase, partial [Byssovorax sp.]
SLNSQAPPPFDPDSSHRGFQLRVSSSSSSSSPEIEAEILVDLDDALVDAPAETKSEGPPRRSARESMISRVGAVLSDRYRVDALVAEGGMGAVFRGEHVLMKKRVAIKLLRPEIERFPELVERFEREAVAGAHVDHKNVAAATDFGRLPDGSYFLVLEYVEGETLRQRIKRAPVAPKEAIAIARQIAEGLDACHRMGVVHRDLKPGNVMLEASSGLVKLIDFGLAKAPSLGSSPRIDAKTADEGDADPETLRSITLKGVVFGTVAYMAPEAEFGMGSVDHRADLYALGVVLYEMLTGKHPFDALELPELFLCHKASPPPPFAARAPSRVVSRELEAITMRLLEKRRADRFASASDVVAALDAAAAAPAAIVSEPTFDPVTASPTTPSLASTSGPAAPPARRRSKAWIVAVGVAALLAAAAFTPRAHVPEASRGGSVARALAAAVARDAAKDGAPRPSATDARRALHDAAAVHAWTAGGDALIELATSRPGDHEGSASAASQLDASDLPGAASVALALAFAESPEAAPVFDALAHGLGAWGVDVLFDVSSKHGGARGARRADELLAEPAVRASATPALRAALALRDARCDDKPATFDGVARDGDERALMLLERLRGVNCTASRCCYLKNKELERSIAATRARLDR